jgi:hypothetical protein
MSITVPSIRRLSVNNAALWDFYNPTVSLQYANQSPSGGLVSGRIQASLVDVWQGDHGLFPLIEQPSQKPLRQPKVWVYSGRAQHPQGFARVMLCQRNSRLHILADNLRLRAASS